MFTDIVIIAILIICILVGFYKGFASSSLEFLSSFLSLIASYFIAGFAADFIFETFFRMNVAEGILLSMQGIGSEVAVETLVNGFLIDINADFLQGAVANFTSSIGFSSVSATMDGALLFTDSVIRPFAEVLIGFVVFIIVFLILRILIRQVAKSLEIVNKIPLIGLANKLMGIVSGAVIGVIYSTLVTFIFILVGLVVDSPTLSQNLITDSRIVSTALNFIISVVN